MQKRLISPISILLVLVMLVNMLPVSVFAATADTGSETTSASQDAPEEARVVAELPEERTEYTKTFRLSNGLHVATVYGSPVHYEKNGQWVEIDNTLKASGTGTDAVLTNTAGVWDVRFPQQLSDTKAVTITKDGYTLSFFMSGQLRSGSDNVQIAAAEAAELETFAVGSETFSVQAASTAAAQVQEIDLTEEKAQVQYPETVSDTIRSQLKYQSVYTNTDVVYDLASNRVKESVVINAYDAGLQGYKYTLNVGSLVPVLTEENEILLYDENKENVVMVMPAPYLVDDAGEYCGDVAVALAGKGDTYVLAYTLPQAWMADESRAYPVILDPVIEANDASDNIQDVSVYEMDPEDYTRAVLDVGRSPKYGTTRGFVKFITLPTIDPMNVIVDATFSLRCLTKDGRDIAVGAHKVETTWTDSTMTWDNQPEHDAIVIDYCFPKEEQRYEWDVTEIVRDWYTGENTGLMLRVSDEWEAKSLSYSSLRQFGAEGYRKHNPPQLTITYRNVIGIEPYYTYATLGAGEAGGAHISDSTGQLTATRAVVSYASTVNPFSASLVYNSIYSMADNTAAYVPPAKLGLPMNFGSGWTLDVIQKIEEAAVGETTYLKYTDGDGTIHYFTKSGSVYYDEDGLGLEIVVGSDGSYTMRDAMDNQWFFTSLGSNYGCFLTSTLDNNGNGYQLNYSSGKLNTIVQQNKGQTAITVATFTYSGNYISRITDASGNYTAFTYSGGKLTGLSHNTTAVAQYAYDGYRLNTLTDVQRSYALHLSYASGKVSGYYEKAGGVIGVRCDITYPGFSQTTYRHYGNDRTKGTADDLYTHYLFDYSGRTVNAYTTDSTQTNILGASNAVYTDNDGISKQNNRTLRSASIGVAAQKLLTQSSFESTIDEWTYNGTEADTDNPRTGLYSLKGELNSAAESASASRTSMTLTKGKVYTLSAYVNTADITSATGSGVFLRVKESGGTIHTGEAVDYITSEDIDEGWVRIALTFTAASSGTATVSIQATGMVGTFYADDVQLELGEAPSNYNLLENGDFQVGTAASGWTLSDKSSLASGIGVNTTASSAQALKFQSAVEDQYANAVQTINVNLPSEKTYVLSGWAKANAVPDNVTIRSYFAYDHSKQFGLRAVITYTTGTDDQDYYYVPFNGGVSEWQFTSLTIIPDSGKTVSTIAVSCVYETNANVAYFDNISLVLETAQSTTYDDNGNPTASSTTGLNNQTVTYDSNGNVSKVVQKTGTGSSDKITTTYTYDSTFVHRMLTSSNGVVTQTLTHDTVGNVLTSTLKGTSGKGIVTSSAYTNSGNLVSSVTDSAGNTTSYAYSSNFYEMLGQASTVTDAKGTAANYTLDSFGRITNMALADLASMGYTYSNGMLNTLTRTAGSSVQTYDFAYDSFGNTTGISVGDSFTLAEYLYGARNGLLTSQTYGNGDSVSFTYDNLGRVKTTTYSDGRVLTYRYTGDGQLYSVQDSKTGYTYQYSYDTLGRLISSSVKNSSGDILTTRQTYDANNQLTSQSWQLGSTAYSETYTYSKTTGLLATHTPAVGSKLTFGYDALQRLSTVTGGIYGKTYTYRDVGDNTTTQVSKLTYDLATDIVYNYTYDVLGNIATYTQGGTTYTYTYDAQNQLLKQTGGGKTYTYTYDAAGNILTASDGTTSHSYTYGHAAWKDLLTAFDGETISYDGAGNPTSYYNGTRWTFGWQEGRRLVSASGKDPDDPDVTTQVSYAYDADGLRTKKTVVTTVAHTYTGIVVAPTCTEGGYTVYTCECGDSYQTNATAATGHSYSSVVTAPTCTESGYTTYTCACGHSYQGNETAATGHSYSSAVTAPTCTESGYTTYTCECGHSYQGNETAATGHSYSSAVTAPTCTENGYTTYTCACGHSYQETIAATGHSYTSVVTAPTCTENGYTTHTCACGDTYQDSATDALGHDYEESQGDGVVIYTCSRCSHSYSEHVHSYTSVTTAPTCTENGYTTRTCACGYSYRINETEALGHTYSSVVTAPTCTENGYTTHTCACGDSYQDSATDALGHDYVESQGDSALIYTCSRCSHSYSVHVHSYTAVVTAPTCTENGYTTHTCACGYSYRDNETEALGHIYGVRYTCLRCGALSPDHTHAYTATDIIEPTCTEGGCTTYTCECGDSYLDDFTDPLGHNYLISTLKATCTRCGEPRNGDSDSGELEPIDPVVPGPIVPSPGITQSVTQSGSTQTAVTGTELEEPVVVVESVTTETHSYIYHGSTLARVTIRTVTEEDGDTTTQTATQDFFYDAQGNPYAVKYKGTLYYYITNLQGDVLHITNSSGTTVVSYTYDPYGKPLTTTGSLASTLGAANPLRYRGYYFDSDSGLYYLQSRYYDPEIGRFLNADSYASTGQGILGCNMFAYCRNNPVSRKDASGTEDVCATDFSQDDNHANDLGNPIGSGTGGGNSSTSHSNADLTSVDNFLTSHGENPADVLQCYSGEPQLQVLTNDTTVFRVWGGTTSEYGHWVSPYNYGEAARSLLSLPPGNTMTNISSFVIPKGTTVLVGVAAPYFGQLGGGVQWWIARIESR